WRDSITGAKGPMEVMFRPSVLYSIRAAEAEPPRGGRRRPVIGRVFWRDCRRNYSAHEGLQLRSGDEKENTMPARLRTAAMLGCSLASFLGVAEQLRAQPPRAELEEVT